MDTSLMKGWPFVGLCVLSGCIGFGTFMMQHIRREIRKRSLMKRILAEIESLPVGIAVRHSPVRPKAVRNPSPKQWLPKYLWDYRTSVEAIDRPLRLFAVGRYVVSGAGWVPHSLLGRERPTFDVFYGPSECSMWSGLSAAEMLPGQEVIQTRSCSHGDELKPFIERWVFVGIDESGQRFKGVGDLELLGELEDSPTSET
jgi:hypothetical protein